MEPPAAVLVGKNGTINIPAVRSYFEDLYRDERVVSRSLKVVLVGREGTGKTRCSPMLPTLFSEIVPHDRKYGYVLHYLLTCQPTLPGMNVSGLARRLACTDIRSTRLTMAGRLYPSACVYFALAPAFPLEIREGFERRTFSPRICNISKVSRT